MPKSHAAYAPEFRRQMVEPISGTLIAEDDTTGPQLTFAGNWTAGAATVNPSFAFTGTSAWTFVGTDVSS